MTDLRSALDLLTGQSDLSFTALFWYTLVFDLPRYACMFVALALGRPFDRAATPGWRSPIAGSRVSVIVVGYNEAQAIERCVKSLREQSLQGFEIVIVSDGSEDRMAERADELVSQGLADRSVVLNLRGGKPAGSNLALWAARGEFIVEVDCDCSFDRFAIERIVAPLIDPTIGAVSGDIIVRNADHGLIARFQAIEYMLSISVAKRFDDALSLVRCVSGAFGGFRRQALADVGGHDAGSGEDFDLTVRLRTAGWRIAFAGNAICYTDVPETLWAFYRQRMRWEGDSIGLRLRKHVRLMLPGSSRFNLLEAIHQWDFLAFGLFGAVVLPFYVTSLFALYGNFALVVLLAISIALSGLNVIMLLLAAIITGRNVFFPNLIYVPGFTVFNAFVMRTFQLIAYCQEWFLFRSSRDNYSPFKVRAVNDW